MMYIPLHSRQKLAALVEALAVLGSLVFNLAVFNHPSVGALTLVCMPLVCIASVVGGNMYLSRKKLVIIRLFNLRHTRAEVGPHLLAIMGLTGYLVGLIISRYGHLPTAPEFLKIYALMAALNIAIFSLLVFSTPPQSNP